MRNDVIMSVDKAYIMGLVVGGARWGEEGNSLCIRLPYKRWGAISSDQKRVQSIARDIHKVVIPLLLNVYGITACYEASNSSWDILCSGDFTELRNDLEACELPCKGEMRKNILSLERLILKLHDENLKKQFIAGIVDTIGSMSASQRRYNIDCQIISIEISGYNFGFVCSLCRLLYSIGCYPDQILWNHPNFHASTNPYESKWKKGFKLRILADVYEQVGANAFESKRLAVRENIRQETAQQQAEKCESVLISTPRCSCLHPDEGSCLLPENIRGGHYIHNRHVCAVMGCKHAPYDGISAFLAEAEKYVTPFPVLVKGTLCEIEKIIGRDDLLASRTYKDITIKVADLLSEDSVPLRLSADSSSAGYRINDILNAVTYVVAAKFNRLSGKRPRGKRDEILGEAINLIPDLAVVVRVPDLLTPMQITLGDYSALVGPYNPKVYSKLISFDPYNKYKMYIRPISEADLR